jgi:hypothetical protein
MERLLVLLFLLGCISICVCPLLANGTAVYVTSRRDDADIIVYQSKTRSGADWVIRWTDKRSDSRPGMWYRVNSRSRADLVVYFTSYRSEADRIVYFTTSATKVKTERKDEEHPNRLIRVRP